MTHSILELSQSLTDIQNLLKSANLFDDMFDLAIKEQSLYKDYEENEDTTEYIEEIHVDEHENLNEKFVKNKPKIQNEFIEEIHVDEYENLNEKSVKNKPKVQNEYIEDEYIIEDFDLEENVRNIINGNEILYQNESFQKLKCVKCPVDKQGTTFKNQKSLKEHQQKIHNAKLMACDFCDKTFKRLFVN